MRRARLLRIETPDLPVHISQMRPLERIDPAAEQTQVWVLLRALARAASSGKVIRTPLGLRIDPQGRLIETHPQHAWVIARPDLESGWSAPSNLEAGAAKLLDLYMPLCVGARSGALIVAHLGQSSDGHCATLSSVSKFITGAEDIRHTHRLRALFDVVLVGASTVAIDNPLLTTRLVPGAAPVRVILDPRGRLPPHHLVFSDRTARTLVVHARGHRARKPQLRLPRHVEILDVSENAQGIALVELIEQLGERGLRRIFIEGGSVTVLRFLRAKLLDRLQLAIAPVRFGPLPSPSDPALTPVGLRSLGSGVRRFALGDDVLFEGALPMAAAE
jgi:diaminohydroxyphosphoribosylaminopyrimidine deaminase/5-amino-6-(5-phosphoribosylamino)uracil reductase